MERIDAFLSVIVPAYNEAERLKANLQAMTAIFDRIAPNYELILSDDGSRDNTFDCACAAAAENSKIKVVSHRPNQGKGAALTEGFRMAKGDLIAFCDADLDLDPTQLLGFYQKMIATGADVVIGSKRCPGSAAPGYPAWRRTLSDLYARVNRMLFGVHFRDTQTGLKLFRRKALEGQIEKTVCWGFSFDLELLLLVALAGFKVVEAPVVILESRVFRRLGWFPFYAAFIDTMSMLLRLKLSCYYRQSVPRTTVHPPVSVVVPLIQFSARTQATLEALKRQNYQGSLEILLLPDALPPETVEGAQVVPTGPLSRPGKCDQGWQRATGKIVAFLDDGALPRSDWATQGVAALLQPGTAAVGGPQGFTEKSPFWERLSGHIFCNPLVAGFRAFVHRQRAARFTPHLPSGNLFVRRETLEKIGGYAWDFDIGEDTFLCEKLQALPEGGIRYSPFVYVFQRRPESLVAHLKQVARYALYRGLFAARFKAREQNLRYTLATLGSFFLLFGWLPGLASGTLLVGYGALVGLYLLLVAFFALWSFSARLYPGLVVGIVLSHLACGLFFPLGLLQARFGKAVKKSQPH